MNHLVKSEFYKLKYTRMFWFLISLLGIYASAVVIIRAVYMKEMTGMQVLSSTIGADSNNMQYFPTILAGIFICKEYQTGVLKNVVSSGNQRSTVLLSKLVGFIVGAMIISIVVPICTWIEVPIFVGHISLPSDGSLLMYMLRVLCFTSLFSAEFVSFILYISVILEDAAKVVGFLSLFFMMKDFLFLGLGTKFHIVATIYKHSILNYVWHINDVTMTN